MGLIVRGYKYKASRLLGLSFGHLLLLSSGGWHLEFCHLLLFSIVINTTTSIPPLISLNTHGNPLPKQTYPSTF